MNNVLQFKQRPVTGTQPRVIDRPRYFCKACDCRVFYLMNDNSVVCAGCESLIWHLKVNDMGKA